MNSSVYFASDTHFGAGSAAGQRARVARFTAWLESLEDASHLYLLGDIFDFWLDYPSFMPKSHMDVLYALRRLQDRGTELTFVGGNHDVWCEDFFRETLKTPVLACGEVVEHQGVRLRLDHGDGLLTGDRFYKVFRWLVRNPVAVFFAKAIHPELLHRFALSLSRHSREQDRSTREDILKLVDQYGRSHSHADVDHLVIGHIHTPCQLPYEGWTFNCLGDWVVNFTAARLRDGVLELLWIDQQGKSSTQAPSSATAEGPGDSPWRNAEG